MIASYIEIQYINLYVMFFQIKQINYISHLLLIEYPHKNEILFPSENNNELNVSIAYVIMGIPAKFDSIDVAFKP